MKLLVLALALAAVASYNYGYRSGFIGGDQHARTDYAGLVNDCYPDAHSAGQLYDCIASGGASEGK